MIKIRQRLRDLATPRKDPVWEGVYERFADVPVSGPGHAGEEWIHDTVAETERVRAAAKAGASIPAEVTEERSLLPLLVALVAERTGGPVRIIDFGGGAGADYVRVRSGVPAAAVEYHVVENERLCHEGRRIFLGDDRIRFHTSLSADIPGADIVYLCSVLQYVEDYGGLLARLCALRARYVLFVKLSAGEVRSFATAQKNVGQSSIPYWFLDIGEVISLMARGGYAPAFKASLARSYDQAGFPPERRVERMCNLLFVAASSGPTDRGPG